MAPLPPPINPPLSRCFVFVCSQLQHTYSAVFLLPFTVASDLLVHEILLNAVLQLLVKQMLTVFLPFGVQFAEVLHENFK